MISEVYRPTSLNQIIGHNEAKEYLRNYLKSDFLIAPVLIGFPGIGKTTLAICAASEMGFDILEINASKYIRSFEDVERIKNSCKSTINIQSFMRGDLKTTCLILDEIDGSDPHAQTKIVDWVKDPQRKIPIIFTGNDLPVIFKRNKDYLNIIQCYPPRLADIQIIFPNCKEIAECQHDLRRIINRLQYGISDILPKYPSPSTSLSIEKQFKKNQDKFNLEDPLMKLVKQTSECQPDKLDKRKKYQTKLKCKRDEMNAGKVEF